LPKAIARERRPLPRNFRSRRVHIIGVALVTQRFRHLVNVMALLASNVAAV